MKKRNRIFLRLEENFSTVRILRGYGWKIIFPQRKIIFRP